MAEVSQKNIIKSNPIVVSPKKKKNFLAENAELREELTQLTTEIQQLQEEIAANNRLMDINAQNLSRHLDTIRIDRQCLNQN